MVARIALHSVKSPNMDPISGTFWFDDIQGISFKMNHFQLVLNSEVLKDNFCALSFFLSFFCPRSFLDLRYRQILFQVSVADHVASFTYGLQGTDDWIIFNRRQKKSFNSLEMGCSADQKSLGPPTAC